MSCDVGGLLTVPGSPVAERGFWGTRASVVAAHGLQSTGSVVVEHGPSCSTACVIFPDQGSNPCLLHWQTDSLPLRHQGGPVYILLHV